MSVGELLYREKGCSACHGLSGGGSDIAPALPGHSAEQVRRQVRNPLGVMPRFGPDVVSDEELELLVAFVESLDPRATHDEPIALAAQETIAMHHWMALMALAADDRVEAEHHVGHIVELLEDGAHRHAMELVLSFLESGALHDAEHEIEKMLAGTAEPALSMGELHLQLTLSSIRGDDDADASHHVQHFIDEADDEEREGARQVLEHLSAEDGEEEHATVELLESIAHQRHQHD